MNKDLQTRIEQAIEWSKVTGIDVHDGSYGHTLSVAKFAKSLAAKNPGHALRRIQIGPDRYRYIPLDGVRLSKVGQDADDCGGHVDWYSVERPDGQSFAIAHIFTFGTDDGAKSCDLSGIPEFLLVPKKQKKEKQLVEAA